MDKYKDVEFWRWYFANQCPNRNGVMDTGEMITWFEIETHCAGTIWVVAEHIKGTDNFQVLHWKVFPETTIRATMYEWLDSLNIKWTN